MQMDLMIGDFFQVVKRDENTVFLKFQMVLPSVEDPKDDPLKSTFVIAKDISIVLSKKNIKELARLINEFIL